MGVICKDLERDRIHYLPIIVVMEMELDQLIRLQRLASDRIRAMFLQPWEYVGDVEY